MKTVCFIGKYGSFAEQKKNAGYYLGAMQVGDEQVVICRYLSNTELSVRDFLLKKSQEKWNEKSIMCWN